MWNNSKEKIFMGPQENNLQKLQISQNEILRMTILPVFSQFLWNLKFIFSDSHKNLFFGVISHNVLQIMAFETSVKKNAIWLKIFRHKVFVHWKLKWLIYFFLWIPS